jgi:hypothetical protein
MRTYLLEVKLASLILEFCTVVRQQIFQIMQLLVRKLFVEFASATIKHSGDFEAYRLFNFRFDGSAEVYLKQR